MLSELIDKIKLPFRKEKELYLSLHSVLGFYPRNIEIYKLALMHKSVMRKGQNGKPINNERLEFLGDAILDAIVGDIVYQRYPGKREGFLTNTRSKIVQRDTLNTLAKDLGLTHLILSSGHNSSHNSYVGGNAFEALVGAIYLDRGYNRCMKFMEKRILREMINIDKIAYKEVNFKSKLIEWGQKRKVNIDFVLQQQEKDSEGNPFFVFSTALEGLPGATGKGYSKKESQQIAAQLTMERIRQEPKFVTAILDAKKQRLETTSNEITADDKPARQEIQTNGSDTEKKQVQSQPKSQKTTKPVSDKAEIEIPLNKEDIIAAAEEAAFGDTEATA